MIASRRMFQVEEGLHQLLRQRHHLGVPPLAKPDLRQLQPGDGAIVKAAEAFVLFSGVLESLLRTVKVVQPRPDRPLGGPQPDPVQALLRQQPVEAGGPEQALSLLEVAGPNAVEDRVLKDGTAKLGRALEVEKLHALQEPSQGFFGLSLALSEIASHEQNPPCPVRVTRLQIAGPGPFRGEVGHGEAAPVAGQRGADLGQPGEQEGIAAAGREEAGGASEGAVGRVELVGHPVRVGKLGPGQGAGVGALRLSIDRGVEAVGRGAGRLGRPDHSGRVAEAQCVAPLDPDLHPGQRVQGGEVLGSEVGPVLPAVDDVLDQALGPPPGNRPCLGPAHGGSEGPVDRLVVGVRPAARFRRVLVARHDQHRTRDERPAMVAGPGEVPDDLVGRLPGQPALQEVFQLTGTWMTVHSIPPRIIVLLS